MAMWSCGFRCEENNKQATAPTNQADQNSRKCNDVNVKIKRLSWITLMKEVKYIFKSRPQKKKKDWNVWNFLGKCTDLMSVK